MQAQYAERLPESLDHNYGNKGEVCSRVQHHSSLQTRHGDLHDVQQPSTLLAVMEAVDLNVVAVPDIVAVEKLIVLEAAVVLRADPYVPGAVSPLVPPLQAQSTGLLLLNQLGLLVDIHILELVACLEAPAYE